MATEAERQEARSRRVTKKQADDAEKARALQLRIAGASYEQIAAELSRGVGTVHRWITSALTQASRESADELLRLQLSRLESMMTAIAGAVMNGDVFAQDRFLRLIQEQNKLTGLYERKPEDGGQAAVIQALGSLVDAASRFADSTGADLSVTPHDVEAEPAGVDE